MRLPSKLGLVAFAALATAAPVWAGSNNGIGTITDGVAEANRKNVTQPTDVLATPPFSITPNVIDDNFFTRIIATGTEPVENPSGPIISYGRLATGQSSNPDENTFVVLKNNPGGPTQGFDYGRRFLFQGHEIGNNLAHITRINLDVPRGDIHRITLMTPTDGTQTGFNDIDGSVFNPFTNTLLFSEEGETKRIIQMSVEGFPAKINTLEAHIGLGAFEGIRLDDEGNIYIAEDEGGSSSNNKAFNANGQIVSLDRARQPNSFVYRFVPNNKKRIEDGGKLQALQVLIDGKAVKFGGNTPEARDADIASDNQLKLHTLGNIFPIKWVTIHTSKKDDTEGFDANAAAKAAGATPLKRPENLGFLPGSNFRTFFFDTTGDTNATAGENSFLQARGAYGALFRVDLNENDKDDKGARKKDKDDNDGRIRVFFLGDHLHNSFDTVGFADRHVLLAGEDRGDTLHNQLNTLDSIWAFDTRFPGLAPKRLVAGGEDSLAITEGDNEPTGLYVSNGNTDKQSLMGTLEDLNRARGFFTQMHGENTTFEFIGDARLFHRDHKGRK